MGIDFNKLNPEEAQKIISALKDGRINDQEAKRLGLTAQEQEALNKAFSSGEVQIGDFVLINKGKSKDGKMQYTATKKAERKAAQKEPGFFAKAWNKLKNDARSYAQNFVNAWNKSDGFIETTGAMVGATTKTVTDIVKDNAENIEKGVTALTGSETAGTVASHLLGVGFVADAAEAVEKFGDWSSDKIRAVAKNYSGTERALLEGFADAVDNMNAADIALMFAGGAGAVKYAKELPKILSLLQKAAVPTAAVVTGVGLTSCSPEPDEVNQTVNLTINSNSSLEEALDAILQNQVVQTSILKAILEKEIQNGMSFDEIKELIGTHTELLTTIIDALATNNDLLTEIKNSIETGDADILKALVGIQNSVDVLTDLVADGGNYSEQLQEILNAIKNGNASVDELKSLITNLLFEVQNNGDIQADILAKLEEIQNSNLNEGEKLIQMLELLKNIDNTTQNISEQLNTVINQINQSFGNDKEVQDALNALIKLVQEGNAKQDVTNEMLNKLLEMMQNGVSKEDIKAIIEAISKNGDKIDDVNFFLNKIQNQDQEFQKQVLAALADLGTSSVDALNKILEAIGGNGQKLDAITQLLAKIDNNVEKYGETGKELGNKILEAINQLGVDIAAQLTQILEVINTDKDTGKNIEALLQKVLTNMDGNTKAIIDAISNIKIEGGGSGNVDLSSLEKMLNELLQLTAKNNGLLESIDGKMDVINLTIERAKEEILEKLGQNNSNTTAILNALNEFKNISTANDKEILEKMDTIINILNNIKDSAYDDSALMAKLDDILAAIKDHKVTVDVTGKVTCECNCGGNHEGIIGDLEDILG